MNQLIPYFGAVAPAPFRSMEVEPEAMEQRQVQNETFWYDTTFLTLALGTTVVNSIQNQGDAAFVVEKIMFQAYTAGSDTNQATPNVTIGWFDTGTGKNISNIQGHVVNWYGTGQRPHILANPKMFNSNSTWNVTATNRSAATGFDLFLSHEGYKTYISVQAR